MYNLEIRIKILVRKIDDLDPDKYYLVQENHEIKEKIIEFQDELDRCKHELSMYE